jgi:glycosyltransferase involved in cell wall biosynthesis
MIAVTVCVPVFNAAAFVAETLDSIAAQSFADIKV